MTNFKVATYFLQTSVLALCCLLFSNQALAESSENSTFPKNVMIESVLSFKNHPELTRPISDSELIALRRLYTLSSHPLIWVSHEDLQTNAAEIVRLLESAPESGLPATAYEADALKKRWRELQAKQQVNDFELTLFDTALSAMTLRYLSDVRSGRVRRQNERFGFRRSSDYRLLTDLLVEAVKNREIGRLTERVEPDWQAYRQLKKALEHYRELARNYLFPTLLFEDSVREGDSDPQIKILRHKLYALGLMHRLDDDSDIYRGELVRAIRHYQRLHGLNDDGIIGKKTLAALNRPLLDRVRQLELALERLRWLPDLSENQGLILVNIPAFRLWAYSPGRLQDNSELSMKVVVGIAKKNQTPVFMSDLVYLEFRPFWNVPKKITLKEILPNLLKNPDYLYQQNMELVQYFSSNAEPQPFSPDSLEMLQQGTMKVRQRPGRKNALGLVKFIFPNRYDVYMHDTPARRLFLSERRDFSHGCIRVEQPRALAEFVLQSRQGWRSEQIEAAMAADNNRRVFIKNAIAVLIFYSTAMAIDNEIYFFEDIYDYDERLSQAFYQAVPQTDLSASVR